MVLNLHRKGMTVPQIVKELDTSSDYVEGILGPINNGKVQNLPCPLCQHTMPISRANLRTKCPKCGATLLSVRIKRKVKK